MYHRIDKKSEGFIPCKSRDEKQHLLQYDGRSYNYYFVSDVIVAEMTLRRLVQRHETVLTKFSTQQDFSQDDKSKMQEWEKELEDLAKEILLQKQSLYQKEEGIPGWPTAPLRQAYDAVRKEPLWYLRPELVEDCKSRVGCCSRACGCCQKRHLTPQQHGGIGHCTIECGCCLKSWGVDLTLEKKDQMFDDLKKLLEIPIPAHLARIADAYFEVPKSEPPKPEPTKPKPSKFEPFVSESSESEVSEPEPSKIEPSKIEPSKIEPSKSNPSKSKLFMLGILWGSSRNHSRK